MNLSRRDVLRGASALSLAAAMPGIAGAADAPKPGGVLPVHLPSEQRILNTPLRASTGVYVITSKIIEAPVDEQIGACACNALTIEPGLVIMHAGATETIKRARAAGVEVIAVEYDEYNRFGGGIHCGTMQILRDPGPRKFS